MDALSAARAQLGLSPVYHLVLAASGVGMPVLMLMAEGLWLRTGEHRPAGDLPQPRLAPDGDPCVAALLRRRGLCRGGGLRVRAAPRAPRRLSPLRPRHCPEPGHRRRFALARAAAVAQVALLLAGWGLAQYPYLIYPDVTLQEVAAPRPTLRFLLYAAPAGMAILVPSLWLLFRVFKTRQA
jgi:hypothetical protein